MTKRHLSFLFLLLAGCQGRCGKPTVLPPRAPETFSAPDAPTAVIVPSLGALADRAAALLAAIQSGPAGAELIAAHADLVRQLGFDPLARADLLKIGVDPDRGLAIVQEGTNSQDSVLVVGVKNTGILDAALGKLAADRLGASVRKKTMVGKVPVVTFSAKAGEPAQMAFGALGGSLALASGPGASERAAAVLARKAEDSLASSPRWKRAQAALGKADVVVLGRAPAEASSDVPELALGLSLGARDVGIRVYAALREELRAALWRALPGGGGELVGRLPARAPIYLRAGVAPRQVFELLATGKGTVGQRLAALVARAEERGVKLGPDVLDLLAPGFALSLSLAPGADLSQALSFDPARKNPFQTWTLRAAGRLSDPARAREALDRLAAVAPAIGATVKARAVNGTRAWTASYKLGEGLSWAVMDDVLIVTGGAGELERALNLPPKDAAPAFAPRAREALLAQAQGAALALDFGPLAAQVRQLPPEAFGTGPSGMMARSMAQQLIEPLGKIKAVVALSPAEGGAALDAVIEAQ